MKAVLQAKSGFRDCRLQNFVIAFSDGTGNYSGKLIAGTVSYIPGHFFDIKILLEGPFDDSVMSSNLAILPEKQPYGAEPFSFSGKDFLSDFPGYIVDWLLIDIRETLGGAPSAVSSTSLFKQAVLLTDNGAVLSSDALHSPFAEFYPSGNIYLVVYHRNHLAVMSSSPLAESNGVFEYDFTVSSSSFFGGLSGCTQLSGGSYGMVAGDAGSDGSVDNPDKNDIWLINLGNSGYLQPDFNIDGVVDTIDKQHFWDANAGKSSQVPE